METQVRTPQLIFMQPQRLVVPLFQRPYVWNRENQWEPLWLDLVRMAERVLENPTAKHYPHFLGAVVLQQVPNPSGSMQERTIIDGQQRLTTLQLMFDALHAELTAAGAAAPAKRMETLIANDDAFWTRPEDQFKVWPTNRDRSAFNAVMSAPVPVDYAAVDHADQRLVQAHRYFAGVAANWLREDGDDRVQARASAIETASRDLLQLVVIDLGADENAQEIFGTLNARGAQLTAADLIKNFIFQRLLEAQSDVESAYSTYWRDFESSFWESEFSVGRVRYSRSSISLNHWLIAQTGEEVVAREVFQRFKRYADEAGEPMQTMLSRLTAAARAGPVANGARSDRGSFAGLVRWEHRAGQRTGAPWQAGDRTHHAAKVAGALAAVGKPAGRGRAGSVDPHPRKFDVADVATELEGFQRSMDRGGRETSGAETARRAIAQSRIARRCTGRLERVDDPVAKRSSGEGDHNDLADARRL